MYVVFIVIVIIFPVYNFRKKNENHRKTTILKFVYF